MLHDLRFALRSLARAPGFTALSVLMLATGIGLSVYIFGAINAFALKPLPFKDADSLVHLEYSERANPMRSLALPQADWLDLRARQDALESLAGFYQGTANLGGLQGPPERLAAAWLSPDALGVLGVGPQLGRDFLPADSAAGAPPVAVLGRRAWQLYFNADPDIIGRQARINGRAATIIGVMPEGFAFPMAEALWLPLSTDRATASGDDGVPINAFGRLRPGVSIDQARAGFDTLVQTLAGERSAPLRGDMARVESFADEFIQPQIKQSTVAMLVAVLLVLLIACTNVAALMTARLGARGRELAVRTALGASRRRLVVQILTEALVIAGLATALGWFAATLWTEYGGVDESMSTYLPYWVDYRTDFRDVLFAGAIAFLAAAGAGLAPALRSSRLDVRARLGASGQVGGSQRGGIGRFLVSGEVALGLVLLVGAGVTIKSALDAQHTDIGIRSDGVLTGRIALFDADYPDAAARARFATALQDKLAGLPGVDATTVASTLPLMGYERQDYARAGDAVDASTRLPQAWSTRVGDGFFATFAIGLRAGRLFDARDRADAAPVAIVSAAFAAKAWPGQSAIGQRIRLQPKEGEKPWMEVVGVVADSVQADYIVTSATAPVHRGDGNIYRPLAQDPPAFLSFAVHANGDPAALGEGIRQAVQSIDANLPVYWLRPMTEWRQRIFWGQAIIARMFGAFAVFALLLAGAGIYAVLAFDVAARTREIGVRRALGAPAGAVLAMVLRRSARQVAIGLALGLPLAWGFTMMLQQMLTPGTRSDPAVYAAVIGTLALAIALAAWLPARRALRVDPMVALRDE